MPYLEAPITPSDIHGLFVPVKSKKGEVLDPALEKAIADKINFVCEDSVMPHAVWMSPERDRKKAKLDRVPLEVGGVAVRWVPNEEYAFFPHTHKAA